MREERRKGGKKGGREVPSRGSRTAYGLRADHSAGNRQVACMRPCGPRGGWLSLFCSPTSPFSASPQDVVGSLSGLHEVESPALGCVAARSRRDAVRPA